MSKYAKKIVIRVFRENSWSENRVFMATITPRKKRHAIISQEINTETNKMKDWSRKRKTDFIIGVALQIYLLFPWVQHYTIYGYLFNTLKINDYVQMYNKTLLPSLKEKSWGYTKMSAFVFLIIIILLMVFQLIELMRIYHITTNERTSDYRGFFWIIYLIFFSIFIDKVEFVDYSLIPAYVEVYMIVLLVFLGLWILIDAMLDTWESEHQILISQLEEQEKLALQTKVKILEERYQEMLKSRKVVHDMKNHILALKNYDQERYKAMYGDDGEPYIIEGPTKLVFIQTDKKYIDQIDKELESKEERHKYIGNYDSTVKFHYLSKTAITDMKTERAVKSMICVYIIITLSILNWIMLYAMNEMEKKEKAEREKFLVSMGMDRKERKKMNKREWYIYWIVPTIILIISTILFMRDTMTARMYPDDIRKICELQEAVVIAVWIVINGIYFWIMNRKARRG